MIPQSHRDLGSSSGVLRTTPPLWTLFARAVALFSGRRRHMPPKKHPLIPPEARGTPRRSVKPIARFGADASDSDDDDMPLGASRVKAAESGLNEGSMMDRCRAALGLMQLRPDAFWFAKPVDTDVVPDYLDIINEPSAHASLRVSLCVRARRGAAGGVPPNPLRDRTSCSQVTTRRSRASSRKAPMATTTSGPAPSPSHRSLHPCASPPPSPHPASLPTCGGFS